MTIPVQISPIGAIGTAFPTTDVAFAPLGKDKVLAAIPELVWVDTGASQYSVQIADGSGVASPIVVSRSSVLGPDGKCRYTPSCQMVKYLTAGWFVWEGTSTSPTAYAGPMLFVLNRVGFPTGGLGSKGRVVDFSTSRGDAMWPRAQWITVPVSDIVTPGTDHVFAKVQLIIGVATITPCVGFKLRRDASYPDPEPIGGMPYTSGPVLGDVIREEFDVVVELATDASFQFQWNDRFNGNGATGALSSVAISLTM